MDLNAEQSPSVGEVLQADDDGAPEYLFEQSPYNTAVREIDKARFFSQEWHLREVEKVWRKVWQMACREEEISEPGDQIVYDIVDNSIIVLRADDGSIRAFYNSCLHRGTQLLPAGACTSSDRLRCPYHGWTYDLSGKLVDQPSSWDFPQFKGRTATLVPVKVDTWGGFVFITMDPDAPPLEQFLGILSSHKLGEELARRFIGAHVAKVIDCNWKVGLEAFLEGYHVAEVHPQALPFTGDTNGQLDVWPPHISRMIASIGAPSPRMANASTADSVAALRAFLPNCPEEAADGDIDPREMMAQSIRGMLSDLTGADYSAYSKSEIIDAINYHVFPNLMPWVGHGTPIVYRLRPFGSDPDRSILEVYLLYAAPHEKPRPDPAEVVWLDPGDSWTRAPQLGGLGEIFDQDEQNFTMIQRGLKAGGAPGISPSEYQESRIRFLHDTLDSYVHS